MNFPLYRKYGHNRTFFKIISSKKFEEIQIVGNNYSIHEIEAKILPEFHYVNDLIINHNNHWEVIDEKEYEEVLKRCKNELQKV